LRSRQHITTPKTLLIVALVYVFGAKFEALQEQAMSVRKRAAELQRDHRHPSPNSVNLRDVNL
jgi:hypothetical protein